MTTVRITFKNVVFEVESVEAAVELARKLEEKPTADASRSNGHADSSRPGTAGHSMLEKLEAHVRARNELEAEGRGEPIGSPAGLQRSVAVLKLVANSGNVGVPVSEIVTRINLSGPKAMGNLSHWLSKHLEAVGLTFRDVIVSTTKMRVGNKESFWRGGPDLPEAIKSLEGVADTAAQQEHP